MELISKARSLNPHIGTILTSGMVSQVRELKTSELVDFCLEKPIVFENLRSAIESTLAG